MTDGTDGGDGHAAGPPGTTPMVGMVEEFSRRLVAGWISVPAGSPAVKVDLHVGPILLASTYATVSDVPTPVVGPVVGAGGEADDDEDEDEPARTAPTVPSAPGQVRPNIASPEGNRRNSDDEIRTFSFRIKGIWPFVRKGTPISVRVGDQPLPIHGHGTYLNPPRRGKRSMKELRALLDEGHLLTQWGNIALSKKLDVEWQQQVMALYADVRSVLAEETGYDAFIVYGTLLGAVREGTVIGHDVDFDAAYVSRHTTGEEARAELVDLALMLIGRGYEVEAISTGLHIRHPERPQHRIDLFHLYFDDSDELAFPFGVAGSTRFTRADWTGLEEIEFLGGRTLAPVARERLVEHIYGSDWRRPKPGFHWNRDRTGRADAGVLTTEQMTTVYWADFYARNEYTKGSTFFEFVNAFPDLPASVVDIGCGDGRDSRAFAGAGRRVLGLDQSPVGIEHARSQAAAAGVDHLAEFEVCDVGEPEALGALLSRRTTDGPVAFYLRFFLHAIPEDVQDRLMAVIADVARPGDLFAAEFRTDKDADTTKVHGRHYRRYQNATAFAEQLVEQHGFTILHQEERSGLSPYQGEDPVLYRVVARR